MISKKFLEISNPIHCSSVNVGTACTVQALEKHMIKMAHDRI